MEETDSDSVAKFVNLLIICLTKARKYKIGVHLTLYNNIVIKLHKDVPSKFCICLPTQKVPMRQITNQWKGAPPSKR